MSGGARADERRHLARAAAVLAALAYLPAVLAAAGRMPADSKLYLYLNPGRFLADAAGSFDPRQFAGWVPHQHVSYLWPSGPWFWLFEQLSVPDWVAHRLWIGTLMFAAGLGARSCARVLGLAPLAALVVAVTYQVSPYVLPYVSRTSVMLLPWAGLGWITALTVRALRRQTWGDPALIALVVLTVGAVNATALAMIVPAPLLFLFHAGLQHAASWRQVLLTALRIGASSLATSVWWIVMLVLQARHGTDVLPYSESLADVSLTATSTEVWRGLGYWLFYVRDPFGAATTESLRYLTSTPAILVSFLVPVLGLAGLAWVRWVHRRFAGLLVAVGVVLAVGVHPSDDRSPLMMVLTGNGDDGLALALRSSTRALPLASLGLALAIGSMVAASASRSWNWRGRRVDASMVLGGVVVALVLANLPGMWSGAWVDPALERDQEPPAAWIDAAAALDEGDTSARVLQLPGAEFGAFRWGYTVDQPLPALTDRPVVTRDLLPLGSAAAMDLFSAIDDRVQAGTFEPSSLAPIARLLGADTVWLTNDLDAARFRTARPEVVREAVLAAPGVGPAVAFGAPIVNAPSIASTDERSLGDPAVGAPVPPVELAPVADPVPVVRARQRTIVLAGDGDGVVDAAAAGLLDGRAAIRYSASLDADRRDETLERASAVVVTDSHRSVARHWRSSQDTRGYTESSDPEMALLRDAVGDARLDVFAGDDPDTRTWAEQRGPVRATATAYGEPFAYLPEHRPYMAIDGDPDTAWLVGEHGDPIGEVLRLIFDEPADRIVLRQPDAGDGRTITEITVLDGAAEPRSVELDERSRLGEGQPVAVTGRTVDIRIEAVAGGTPFTAGAVAGVGFAEVAHARGPTQEVVRLPTSAMAAAPADTPLAILFTRLRADPMNRWRDDPEPSIVREFELAHDRLVAVEATARIAPRADDEALADLFGWPVWASSRLTGSLRSVGAAALDGDPATAWVTAFGEAKGATLTVAAAAPPIDTLEVRQPVSGYSWASVVTLRSDGQSRTVELVPDAFGASRVAVEPPLPGGRIELMIAEIEPHTTIDRRFGDVVELPAAISEISFAGSPVISVANVEPVTTDCMPFVTLDGARLTARFSIGGTEWATGGPIDATACEETLEITAGRHLLAAGDLDLPIEIDRVVFDDRGRDALVAVSDDAGPRAGVTEQSRFARSVVVRACDAGCWLVVGEGFNPAWSATADGRNLGEPQLLDGGFNGWWIDPTAEPVEVEVRWTAQRPLTLALIISALAALGALAVVVVDRFRRTDPSVADVSSPTWSPGDRRLSRRTAVVGGVTWVGAAALLIGPTWAPLGIAGGLALVVTRRRRLGELTATATVVTIGAATAALEFRDAPFPGGAWPTTFEVLHGFGMFAVASLLVGIVVATDAAAGAEEATDDRPPEAASMPVVAS